MSLQLGHYPRKKVLISPLPLFFRFFLRNQEWLLGRRQAGGTRGRLDPWPNHGSDPQPGALGQFHLLCLFVVHITLKRPSECVTWCWITPEACKAKSWWVSAKGKATASYVTVGSREKEDTRCQTALLWLNAFAKGAMTTQEGRRKSDTQMKFWLFRNY